MESGTYLILRTCGRGGDWYVANDGSDTQWPVPGNMTFAPSLIPNGGRGASRYAAHTYGAGLWATMGFNLTPYPFSAYDATQYGYTGVSFFAMIGNDLDAGVTQTTAEFAIADQYSISWGGKCNPAPDAGTTGCGDNPGIAVPLTTTWTRVSVPFSALVTNGSGYGGVRRLDPTALYLIQFVLFGRNDLWIDDISFE
jgi:hypothetical protein